MSEEKKDEAEGERMSWQKFGLVKGQPRGTLEPGIIVTSKEEFPFFLPFFSFFSFVAAFLSETSFILFYCFKIV